jgi:nitrile hydratase subunit beta
VLKKAAFYGQGNLPRTLKGSLQKRDVWCNFEANCICQKFQGNRSLNSVHDIGGMDGFGPIHHETDEPVFHELWESRVFGMLLTGAGLPPAPVDALRHRGERLDPVKYLSSSYYERFLAGMENGLIETGTLGLDEIEARVRQLAAEPDLPIPRREDPAIASSIAAMVRAGNPVTRKIRQKPRFATGDKIVTRNLNPHGHTRLPRYARSKRAVVVAHHGAHVFPDSNAHGLGENPQHLYTVRIAMRELWGDSAEANESVLIDLWESYLDKDKGAATSTRSKSVPGAQKIEAKTLPRATKAHAREASAKRSRSGPPLSVSPTPTAAAGRIKRGRTSAGRGSAGSERGSGKRMRRRR